MTTAAEFTISATRVLDTSGKAAAALPDFARNADELTALYRVMTLTRAFDAKAVALQRTGRLGTYASSLGREAVSAGGAAAMRPDDVLLPSFREHTLEELFLCWSGDVRGNDFAAAPSLPARGIC